MARDYSLMEQKAEVVKKLLVSKDVKAAIKTSRYQKQIKALQVSSVVTLDKILESVGINATVDDLDSTEERAISGTYKAKLVTIKTTKNGLKKGDTFFMLNTYTEKGTLKTKDLVPEKIGVVKKYSNISTFDKEVKAGIKAANIPDDIKISLKTMYDEVANGGTSDTIQMSKQLQTIFSKLKQRDKQAIGKDFGEILSLRWCLNQPFTKNMTSFYFSEASNEPLVDYNIVVKEKKADIRIKISAKFEKGGAPSIKAVVKYIDDIYKQPTGNLKSAVEVIKTLGQEGGGVTTSTKILNAHKAINSKAYKILGKIVGTKNPTVKDISTFVEGTFVIKGLDGKKRTKMFNEVFSDFFDELGNRPTDAMLDVIFANNTFPKYHSCIVSPMGYGLVKYMNSTSIYSEILNRIGQQLNAQQVYLNFRSNTIVFTKKLFAESEYEFSYGSSARDSDNTGIKFSMK